MLTAKDLDSLPSNSIFENGVFLDVEDELFMTGSGKLLRWVAVTGAIGDWAIYCHFADRSLEWIRDQGDKVYMETNIKKCVPCDDEAFKRYRY